MESISRISSMLETARDLTLEAAQQASNQTSRSKSTRPLPATQIKKLLDSRNEREVLDGLRRVIAMQYSSQQQAPSNTNTLTFFPAVLKTLSNPYPSTRPLVYNYLLHHAEADPDTALLAVNTIQKSLSDSNPRVRAMALKTMSGIRVPVLSQIVSLAIKKGITDLSPLVRKAAALACVKLVRLDPATRPQVEEYIGALMQDKQYFVAGAAVQAFVEIFREELGEERVLGMVHPVYRRLCRMCVDMDEWGQLAVMRLMTGYARRCFPRRTRRVKKAAGKGEGREKTQEEKAKVFYEDLEEPSRTEENSESSEAEDDLYEELEIVDPDLDLFLKSTVPLLQSRNSAVIIAVTRAYLYLSPQTYLPQTIGPLIALFRSPQDIQQIALHNIVRVCLQTPQSFVPYTRHFLLKATEAPSIRTLKQEILTLLFPFSAQQTQDLILAELEHFSHSHSPDLVRESVRAIGRCAAASSPASRTSRRCLSLLLKQIHSPDPNLVGEAIEVVRHLIQRSPEEHRGTTVVRLAKNLDTLGSATARASIVWLVGEYAVSGEGEEGVEGGIAADVLRILVKGYVDEADEVRAQIVLLAAKCYLHYLNGENAKMKALEALNPPPQQEVSNNNEYNGGTPTDDEQGFRENAFFHPQPQPQPQEEKIVNQAHPISLLYTHTMLLARYTPSYDLRDRARTYRALLSVPTSTELASLLLLAPKPVPQAPSPSEERRDFVLGSASLVVGERGGDGGDGMIPEWVREGEEPDARLREDGDRVEGKAVEYVPGGPKLSAGQRLDEALAVDPGYKASGPAKREKSLDAWLDDEESEETETETESEESEEEGEESEFESESEDEDDEKAGLVR